MCKNKLRYQIRQPAKTRISSHDCIFSATSCKNWVLFKMSTGQNVKYNINPIKSGQNINT